KQPREVHPYNVGKIISLLKEKRAYFKEDMMKYYRFLSKTVSVVGSNDPEQFVITKDADGSLIVHVQKKDSAGSVSATTYHRVFDHIITREIRLYGLEGDDEFIIRGGDNAIQLRLIGGPGDDFFINEGTGGEVLVYDVEYENNKIIGNPGIRNKISDDPLNNEYRQLGNNYNATIPWVAFELTGEGGLFVGPTLEIRTAGFRKDPYASVHYLYATRALSSSSYHLRYDADFFKVRKNTDLLIRTDATLPTVRTYFFGLGNNTFNDPIRDTDPSYYIAQYSRVDMSLMARHAVTKWMNIKWGPVAQYFKLLNNRNRGNYIKTLYPVSSQKGYLYNGLFYGGGEINAQVNTRNHRVFTTQGIHLNIYSRGLRNFSNSSNLRQAGGSVSFFSDFLLKRIIILATSFGADKNFGQFEFPQAQYLGFRQNLRGYRFQRFAGESRAYNNSELRINFGTANFYFFKGLTGLVAFHDIGRVWAKGETSNTLHRGYGAGLWVAPFDKLVFITSVASSKEEKAWLQFTFGFQF
ncbi:MAG TPA: hypothetical protein VM368_09320, partial [Flavisolibacter sp.]|nr:hypothetical protein [Flavisolibacter sp.]